jgi:glycosyltransferase involved in cell wall biosynthesis
MAPVKASILVCGKFHYHNFVEFVAQAGCLRQFIYSHKLSTRFEVGPEAEAINLFGKEYLYQVHYRLLGEWGLKAGSRLYHGVLWDRLAAAVIKPADVLHFLMHGNSARAVRKAKAQGAKLLAEAVNGFPEDYARTINEEYDRLGLRQRRQKVNFDVWAEERELSDFLLVPSRFVQRSYEAHGWPAERILKLPYGANLADFQPNPALRGKFKAVCMAQITPRKGHVYLLEAWKKLALPDAELHCYGYYDREVLQALQSMGVPNVFFHGSVPKVQVIRALQEANVFVLPTIDDGFGVVILEAMAAGLPVITTEHSGGVEIIDEGVNGYVLPIRRSDLLAERLLELYRDPEKAAGMGRAARQKVEKGQSWQDYAARMIAIYGRCAGG